MMNYILTFKREFKLIFKRVGIMVILFIGPLFLTLYFGGVYNNDYVKDIPIAILDEDGSSLSRMVIEQFRGSERFEVLVYPSSRDELEKELDNGTVHLGMFIPSGFEQGAMTYNSSQISLFTDGTNLVVANNAYAQATTIIQTVSAGIEMKLIEGKGVSPDIAEKMALVFNVGERILYDPKMTYMNYLIVSFLCVFLQQLFLAALGATLVRDKEYLTKEHVFPNVLATGSALLVGMIPAISVSLLIINKVFHVTINGNLGVVALMTCIFLLSLLGPALILAAITNDRVKYSQFSLMLSVPTFLSSGCIWPVEQMPDILKNGIQFFWPLIHYAKIVQEVILKNPSMTAILPHIYAMLIYLIVGTLIGSYIFKKKVKSQIQVTI